MDTPADCSSSVRFATRAAACAAAVELARSYTQRSSVIVVPTPYTRTSLTLLCRTMAEASERIAALIVEIEPSDDAIYGRLIRKARELASAESALLIWCETVRDRTAFRGGLQAVYRIKADLTCLTYDGDATWLCGKPEVLGHDKAA